ncbi:MAG: glucose 1-dehydrogenase [Chloroflexota bacterium]
MRNLPMFDLSGQVAVVTGGYRGIGYGISEGLAEAGANLVICSRHVDRCEEACHRLEKLGIKAIPLQCNVSNKDDVENLIATTVNEFGKIDILVNNAGTTGSASSVVEMSDEAWDETVATDLTGPFLCSRAAARQMIKQNGGRIINIASYCSFMPIPHSADYCASKAGLLLLTKTMAVELIKYNVYVNAICPGYFATDLNPTLIEKMTTQAKKRIPIARLANVDEIKGITIYLASSASTYMVGSAIILDGGISLK